ncbi:hypothetical protein JRO89_XS04G0184000 [Xanthoceras sorbifolium]|uniref:Major facilitator superfamily (MFS) profile domain-containing protein n=1 Tax=Xanthoceras sorbifolium TaxID=99658 RepID=A0ABQ8I5U9_9ROSI|nr:hypothetical protein JRO89_XS04G0184000 [Xanthoceras sorbifolium]
MEEGLGDSLIEAKSLRHNDGSTDMSKSSSSNKSSSTTAVLVLSTLVAVCGSFCYGCAVGYSSPAESGIIKDLGLSVAAYSVFGSILTVGGMIGAILSGKIADIFGRKRAMWFSDMFCTIGWFAIAFAEDSLWLDLGRTSIGFGVGIISYVVPVYIAEIAPKDLRGVFTSFNQMMLTCGFSLAFFIGNVISWRSLALVGAIPCLLQFIGLFFIPESPRWLIKMGREKEFENALQRVRGMHADISLETAEIRDFMEASQKLSQGGILDLFQRRYANSLIIGVGLMLLQQLGGNSALSYYASTIFEEAGLSIAIGTTAAAILEIPVTAMGVLLMDKAGRRPLLLISASGLCFFYFLMGLSFTLQAAHILKKVIPVLVLIGLLVIHHNEQMTNSCQIAILSIVLIFHVRVENKVDLGGFEVRHKFQSCASEGCSASNSTGMAGVPWVIMSEIFPLNIKASAGSLVTLVNWSCSWIVTYTFNFIFEWSPAGDTLFSLSSSVEIRGLCNKNIRTNRQDLA